MGAAAGAATSLRPIGYPATPEAFARRFDRLRAEPAASLFVVTGLRVLNLVERDGPVGRLIALVVAEAFRGKDVGRALVDHVEACARRAGMHPDRPQLERPSDAAHACYRRSASPTPRGAS